MQARSRNTLKKVDALGETTESNTTIQEHTFEQEVDASEESPHDKDGEKQMDDSDEPDSKQRASECKVTQNATDRVSLDLNGSGTQESKETEEGDGGRKRMKSVKETKTLWMRKVA